MDLKKQKFGFTLIELAIVIGILGFISITIAVLTSRMISMYQKGNTMKRINTVGSELVEEIRSAIGSSAAKGITDICSTLYSDNNQQTNCKTDRGEDLIITRYVTTNVGAISLKGSGENIGKNTPIYGSFCSGSYTYIWNSGYFFGNLYNRTIDPISFRYYYLDEEGNQKYGEIKDFSLIKIFDPSRDVCYVQQKGETATKGYGVENLSIANITVPAERNVFPEAAVELISNAKNNDLAIYDLDIYFSMGNYMTGNIYYYGSFILGSTMGGINIKANNNYCKTPDTYEGGDFDYCAINKFNFAAQASGE